MRDNMFTRRFNSGAGNVTTQAFAPKPQYTQNDVKQHPLAVLQGLTAEEYYGAGNVPVGARPYSVPMAPGPAEHITNPQAEAQSQREAVFNQRLQAVAAQTMARLKVTNQLQSGINAHGSPKQTQPAIDANGASTQTTFVPGRHPSTQSTPMAQAKNPPAASTPDPEFAAQLENEQYEYSADPLNEQQAYNDRLIYGQAQQIGETLQSQYNQVISGITDWSQLDLINEQFNSNYDDQMSSIGYSGEVEQRISQHRQQQYGTIQTMVQQLQSFTDKFNGTDNNKGTYKQQMLQRRSPFNGLVNKTTGVSKRT